MIMIWMVTIIVISAIGIRRTRVGRDGRPYINVGLIVVNIPVDIPGIDIVPVS
jgi:hypothetical protein